jgi:hypothetical protein
MLRLYGRFLRARDLDQLADLARDVTADVRARANSTRSYARYGSRNSLPLTQCELFRSIGRLIDPTPESFGPVPALAFTLGVTITSTMDEQALPRYRAAFSFFFTCLPWNSVLNSVLNVMAVPAPARPFGRALVLASAQVFSIEISQPSLLTDPFTFCVRSGLIAAVLHVTSSLTKSLTTKFPIVPGWAWSGLFSFGLNRFVQRLARFGLYETTRQTLLDWAGFLLSFRGELQPVIDPPPDLECTICRELLRRPVEVLGFHFCEECLSNWLNQGAVAHPMTGEPISREQVSRAVLMTLISNRYRDLVIAQHAEPHPDPE